MNPELLAKLLKSFGLDPSEFTKYLSDLQNTLKYFDTQIKTLVESNNQLKTEVVLLREQNHTRFDLIQTMIEDYQDGKRNGPGDGSSLRPN